MPRLGKKIALDESQSREEETYFFFVKFIPLNSSFVIKLSPCTVAKLVINCSLCSIHFADNNFVCIENSLRRSTKPNHKSNKHKK